MTASERRPTLGSKESRSCELQVSNGQPSAAPSFKSDEHHVEEWGAQCAQRSALMPARSQREPAGSASASRGLRQHSASASRWLRSLAPCMHSATLRQRFALAPRSSSAQSALRAACCDPRCLHTGPLNPRGAAALRAAAVTVTACGSSHSAIDRGTLEASVETWNTGVWFPAASAPERCVHRVKPVIRLFSH